MAVGGFVEKRRVVSSQEAKLGQGYQTLVQSLTYIQVWMSLKCSFVMHTSFAIKRFRVTKGKELNTKQG